MKPLLGNNVMKCGKMGGDVSHLKAIANANDLTAMNSPLMTSVIQGRIFCG
jgi:hypothetical protein